jgi:hypothetical protein
MKGVWEYKMGRTQTTVKIDMFSPTAAAIREGIEAEAERLDAFLNTKVAVEFEDH